MGGGAGAGASLTQAPINANLFNVDIIDVDVDDLSFPTTTERARLDRDQHLRSTQGYIPSEVCPLGCSHCSPSHRLHEPRATNLDSVRPTPIPDSRPKLCASVATLDFSSSRPDAARWLRAEAVSQRQKVTRYDCPNTHRGYHSSSALPAGEAF